MSAEAALIGCCCTPAQSEFCNPPVTSFVAMISSAILDFDYVSSNERIFTGAVRSIGGNQFEVIQLPLQLSSGYLNTPIVMQNPIGKTFWCGEIQRPPGFDPAFVGFVGSPPPNQGWSSGIIVTPNQPGPITFAGLFGSLAPTSQFSMKFSITRFRFPVPGSWPTTYYPYHYEFAINCLGVIVPLVMRLGSSGCPTGPWRAGDYDDPMTRLRGCIRRRSSGSANSECGSNYPMLSSDFPEHAVGNQYDLLTMI